jgi:hypothetical protein
MQARSRPPARIKQTTLVLAAPGCATTRRDALVALMLQPGVRAAVVHDDLRTHIVVRFDRNCITAAELHRTWMLRRDACVVSWLARLLRWGPHVARLALVLARRG